MRFTSIERSRRRPLTRQSPAPANPLCAWREATGPGFQPAVSGQMTSFVTAVSASGYCRRP